MPPASYPSPPADDVRQEQEQALEQALEQDQAAQTPPAYISQALAAALESPVTQDVYNLAATLTTQRDDDAHYDATLRSLRADVDEHAAALAQLGVHLDQQHATLERSTRERERTELEHRNHDRSDRLRRVMNRLGRLHDPYRTTSPAAPTPTATTTTTTTTAAAATPAGDHGPAQGRLASRHGDARSAAAYGDRVPSRNSLYDWSPATDGDDDAELEGILAELRREQPNTQPEILRVLGRSQLDSERERSRAAVSRLLNSSQPSQSADSSLRSAALLQSVRRNPRFAARSRDLAQRHADRDAANRSPLPPDARDRSYMASESTRVAMDRWAQQHRTLAETTRDRDMLQRVDSYRRSYLERTSNPPPAVSPMLEQTIKYLSQIRHSSNVDDSLNHAIDAGFLGKDYFVQDHQDFVLDPCTIPPPAETSWLAPGAVLSGCQHATAVTSTVMTAGSGTGTTLYRYTHTGVGLGLSDVRNTYTSPRNRTSLSPPEVVTSHSPQTDRWPVKVTIHSVDYDRMSLSATMEAYNVPSHPHSHQSLLNSSDLGPSFTRTSSITTYLEGEILDFNTHTLLTESFKSTAGNDATYWRKLPIFKGMTDDDMVRCLTSRTWFDEVLSKEWILMRWKERCFVKSINRSTADPIQPPASTTIPPELARHSTSLSTSSSDPAHIWGDSSTLRGGGDADHTSFDDSGCGLTISGFYYVCLRRSDGKLEGLYFDPQSSPYQCLKLESVRGGVFPAWGFR